MYAIFIRPQAYTNIVDNALATAVGTALLVLIGNPNSYQGFGLFFSYIRNLAWSGLGFTFLITTIVFQFYFLVNAFWTKANVQLAATNFVQTSMFVYLSEENGANVFTYGATAVGAFKCSLSMSIAFAAIGGRGGPLEALIISIIGTIVYELNRQILTLFSVDFGGSMTIFEFGGIFGTVISVILCHFKQQ